MNKIPEDPAAICFHYNNGCRFPAEVHMFCKVEGRDTHFCSRHWREWQRSIAGDEPLSQHCPRCAPAFIARREAQASAPNIKVADEPITGPLAEAIDRAMHAEGVLAPTRERILRRLAADTDAYVAAVMSRASAAVI